MNQYEKYQFTLLSEFLLRSHYGGLHEPDHKHLACPRVSSYALKLGFHDARPGGECHTDSVTRKNIKPQPVPQPRYGVTSITITAFTALPGPAEADSIVNLEGRRQG